MLNRASEIGTRSGMPRYMALLAMFQIGVLFVPEFVWAAIGFDASHVQLPPTLFVTYYVDTSTFKSAMLAFWLLSPFTLTINSAISIAHLSGDRYKAFLQRRARWISEHGRGSAFGMLLAMVATTIVYVWSTVGFLSEPLILGNFVPPKNRLAMTLVHGGFIGLVFPIILSCAIAELRATFLDLMRLWRGS